MIWRTMMAPLFQFQFEEKKTNIDSLKKLFKLVDCHDLENYDGTAVPI